MSITELAKKHQAERLAVFVEGRRDSYKKNFAVLIKQGKANY